ncbi:DoxX family protein [Streptomyces sp. NPDC003691]
MDTALWLVSGGLGLLYLTAGLTKVIRSRDSMLRHEALAWMNDYSPAAVKAIGALEVLGGIGLVLPWLTGVAPVLTPLAATGLTALQIAAGLVHRRRREPVRDNVVLTALAAFVAVGRFAA